MRRTTICRFERAALLALVAGLLAGLAPALAAQDTTQARPDTSTPAQDTSQAAPAPAPLGQLPATHVVATGETLWSISQLYYSDPLLWPEIYRLNTSLIDDPHWIYPGEELSLAAGASVAQVPPQVIPGDTVHGVATPDTVVAVAPDTTPLGDTATVEAPPPPAEPTEGYQTIFDRRRTATQEVRDVLRAYANQPYRPLRRGEFYAAGFLTEQQRLPYGRVLGNTSIPAIPRLTDRSTAITFDQISIQPPRSASYHEPFKDPGEVHPTPVEGGLEGVVIAERDLHVLAGPQQIVFINRGRAEGVSSGDVFEVFRPAAGVPGTASEQMQVVLQIVHTRDHSASGLILNIGHPKLVPGMPVRLIRKMPS